MSPERLELEALSAIEVAFDRHRLDGGIAVLVMALRGAWRRGSAGNPDAAAMTAWLRAALVAWDPAALVFDFRELEHSWGDAMLRLLEVDSELPDTPLPRAIVVGPGSRGGLASLGATVDDDLDAAIERVGREAAELRRLEDAHTDDLKMYVLVRSSIAPGFAALAAAHAAVATFERFDGRWETRAWISGLFRKVICAVDDAQLERAKTLDDAVVITESALGGAEVAVGLMPRVEWPGWVRHLPLWR